MEEQGVSMEETADGAGYSDCGLTLLPHCPNVLVEMQSIFIPLIMKQSASEALDLRLRGTAVHRGTRQRHTGLHPQKGPAFKHPTHCPHHPY